MLTRYWYRRLQAMAVVCLSVVQALVAHGKPPWRPGGKVRLETAGELSRLIGEGWARSTKSYLDPRVELEFRLVGPESEGAVVVRGFVARQGAYAKSGYRVDLAVGNTLTIKALAEQPVNATSGAAEVRTDQWHRLELTATRDTVRVSIDGGTPATVEGREHQAGYVGLQVKHGTVEFRHIRIAEQATIACSAPSQSRGPGVPQEAVGPSGKIKLPTLVRDVRPRFTLEAMTDHAGGTVLLEVVVLPDGTVGDTCVRRGLHPDLDVEAIVAAREWRFKAGTRNGDVVPVLVTLEMTFEP